MDDDVPSFRYPGGDGAQLTARSLGAGRPVVLLHGLMGLAQRDFLDPGHARVLAEHGFRVVMPDLRGHGDSAAAALAGDALPQDVLVDDGLALVAWLGVRDGDYDLAGYSLGGQLAARMLARGARPGCAVLGAAGLDAARPDAGAGATLRRVLAAEGRFASGSPEARVDEWLDASGASRPALARVLNTLVPVNADGLDAVEVETLVVCGADDERLPACRALADVLGRARLQVVPGDHGSVAFTPRTLGAIIAEFLSSPNAYPEAPGDPNSSPSRTK